MQDGLAELCSMVTAAVSVGTCQGFREVIAEIRRGFDGLRVSLARHRSDALPVPLLTAGAGDHGGLPGSPLSVSPESLRVPRLRVSARVRREVDGRPVFPARDLREETHQDGRHGAGVEMLGHAVVVVLEAAGGGA